MSTPSVIIDDFHLFCITITPFKTNLSVTLEAGFIGDPVDALLGAVTSL